MLNTPKLGNGALLASILVSLAALVWTPAAKAQSGAPTASPLGNSFGGGLPSGGISGLTGGISGLTGGISGLTGGISGVSGGYTGVSGGFAGMTGTSQTFRGGFNGSSLATQANFTGNGNRTGSAGGNYGAAGTSMPSAYSAYYVNPLAAGAPAVSQLADFHTPIFGNGSFQGGGYGGGGPSNSQYPGNTPPPNTTYNQNTGGRRLPSYTVAPAFDYRAAGPSQLQSDVVQVLARSTALSPNRDIRVVLQGPAIVLRGTVANEHDRRLAEGLVRLSPGVLEVRNELEVSPAAPP